MPAAPYLLPFIAIAMVLTALWITQQFERFLTRMAVAHPEYATRYDEKHPR